MGASHESDRHRVRGPRRPLPHLGAADGSDAMNPDPDYSAAYVVLRTDGGRAEGHGFCFTIGRGNDVMAAAIERARAPTWSAARADATAADLGALHRALTHDSQLRWLGPEKGVMHMAAGARRQRRLGPAAKPRGQPLWAVPRRHDPRGTRLPRRLPLPHRRAHPAGGARPPARRRARPRRARRAAAGRGLPRVHHLARLARLRRRQARAARRGGGRRRLRADQAQGGRRPRRRRPPAAARPRRPSAPASGSPSTPTSAGTWPRRSTG